MPKLPISVLTGSVLLRFLLWQTATAGELPSGQELVAQAADKTFAQPSISAKIRQRIDLFGHGLAGSGSYQQLGAGSEKMLRLDLKIQAGGQATSLQQVVDSKGRFLWTRRMMGDEVKLGRVDLRRVRQALRDRQASESFSTQTWLALGGIPKLLHGLDENFEFRSPVKTTLGDVPVYAIPGSWKPKALTSLVPSVATAIEKGQDPSTIQLPPHLPNRVQIWLGVDDLFPYRLQYLRRVSQGDDPSRLRPSVPIVTLEFFDVRLGAPIDPLQFAYKPGDQEVEELTSHFLRKLKLVDDTP